MKHLTAVVVGLALALPGLLLAAGSMSLDPPEDPIAAATTELAHAETAGDSDAIGRLLLTLADAYEAHERFVDAEASHRQRLAWAIDGTVDPDAPAVVAADIARFYARWGDHAALYGRAADAEMAYGRALEAADGSPLLDPGFDARVNGSLAHVYDLISCSRDPARRGDVEAAH